MTNPNQLLENWEKELKKLPNYHYKLDYYKTTQPKDMIVIEPKKFISMVKELLNLQEAKTREEDIRILRSIKNQNNNSLEFLSGFYNGRMACLEALIEIQQQILDLNKTKNE